MNKHVEALQRWLFDPVIGRIVTAIVGLIILHAVLKAMHRTMERRFRAQEFRYRLHKIIKIFGYIASASLVIAVFSDYLGRWTVALGVAGAGIAFALQEVIASIAGWVGISFGGFFSLGDRVQLGGITGDVIDIGMLRTTIMETGQWVKGDQYSGRIVLVANSFIFKEPVYNYTADFPFLWDELMVPVRHGSDHQVVRKILHAVAEEIVGEFVSHAEGRWEKLTHKYMIEKATVHPMVLMAITDNWLEFNLRYVVEYKQRRLVKDRLFTRILEEFEKTEGKITVASTTIELVGPPGLAHPHGNA